MTAREQRLLTTLRLIAAIPSIYYADGPERCRDAMRDVAQDAIAQEARRSQAVRRHLLQERVWE